MIAPIARAQRRRRGSPGQVIVVFALVSVVVLGAVAMSVDGGYGLAQQRRAQNAADFASGAGARQLSVECGGGATPTNAVVYAAVQDVLDQNSTAVGSKWTGSYTDSGGAVMRDGTGTPYPITNSAGSSPPAHACGVSISVTPSWTPLLARMLGVTSMTSKAAATSVTTPSSSSPIGIIALDQLSPHEVLAGAAGSYVVDGSVFLNSSDFYGAYDGDHNGVTYGDTVDGKDSSVLTLHGNIQTVGPKWPFDPCFGVKSDGSDIAPGGPPPSNSAPPTQPPSPDPYHTIRCNLAADTPVQIAYDQVQNNQTQIHDPIDPAVVTGGVLDPFDSSSGGTTQGLCPPQVSAPVYASTPAAVAGVTTLQPGEYTNPVIITAGSVVFADCSGAYEANPNSTTVAPGVFRFDRGLALLTPSGTTVKGNNVMVAVAQPVPLPANVPGSWQLVGGVKTFVASGIGDGAPCYPAETVEYVDGTHPCGGADATSGTAPFKTMFSTGQYYGVISYYETAGEPDPNLYGTGTNFSLVVGGAGTVTLSAPATGPYRNLAVFQRRSVAGNVGLDTDPKDSAVISITGLVYDASMPCYGYPLDSKGKCTTNANLPFGDPFDYWGAAVPYRSGGALQTGMGTGVTYSTPTSGSVTILGPCIVDTFFSDGNTNTTINGVANPYYLPGSVGTGGATTLVG